MRIKEVHIDTSRSDGNLIFLFRSRFSFLFFFLFFSPPFVSLSLLRNRLGEGCHTSCCLDVHGGGKRDETSTHRDKIKRLEIKQATHGERYVEEVIFTILASAFVFCVLFFLFSCVTEPQLEFTVLSSALRRCHSIYLVSTDWGIFFGGGVVK